MSGVTVKKFCCADSVALASFHLHKVNINLNEIYLIITSGFLSGYYNCVKLYV